MLGFAVKSRSAGRKTSVHVLLHQETFPRSLTVEAHCCHSSYLIGVISRVSSDNDSSSNRVSNATGSVKGLMLSMLSLLNNGAPLAVRRLPDSKRGVKTASPSFLDQNRIQHSTSGISRLGRTVCQHRWSVLTQWMRPSERAHFLKNHVLLHLCERFAIQTVVTRSSSRHRRFLLNL